MAQMAPTQLQTKSHFSLTTIFTGERVSRELTTTMTASAEKVNLLGLPKAELEQFFAGLGEKPYRARQVLKWIYHHGVSDLDAIST